uniref:SUEL-type lectin domain-containing protein n=1 Tax=Mastacembelus armatus TaxID=205130 RepID=A0A3Q3MHK0_9TELE
MLCFSTTLLLAATCLLVNAGAPTETVTTCHASTVQHLSCADFGVISVMTALYGRADTVTCSEGKSQQEISNTQCSLAGAVEVLKRRCDGKKTCELNTQIFETDPCRDTNKYLQTTYTCLTMIHHVTCEHSLAHLQCAEEQVLSVYSADYGRHEQTTCSYKVPATELQNTDCSGPTSKVADSCNGKNSCIIRVSNSVFGDSCPGTYKYLELAYNCEYPSISPKASV